MNAEESLLEVFKDAGMNCKSDPQLSGAISLGLSQGLDPAAVAISMGRSGEAGKVEALKQLSEDNDVRTAADILAINAADASLIKLQLMTMLVTGSEPVRAKLALDLYKHNTISASDAVRLKLLNDRKAGGNINVLINMAKQANAASD